MEGTHTYTDTHKDTDGAGSDSTAHTCTMHMNYLSVLGEARSGLLTSTAMCRMHVYVYACVYACSVKHGALTSTVVSVLVYRCGICIGIQVWYLYCTGRRQVRARQGVTQNIACLPPLHWTSLPA